MKNENILNKIYARKKTEVEERKALYPVKLLEKSMYYPTDPVSLSRYLEREDKVGIIAEFKTQSPSKGIINETAEAGKVTLGYMQGGASALSVLTDKYFFKGSFENLQKARKENYCPILQKDFILEPYQIIEAKSHGADAILLIAAMLTKESVKELSAFAASLGLEVLLEIHQKEEVDKISEHVNVVGINNRDLTTFAVDQNHSLALAEYLPEGILKIAESGIKTPWQANNLLSKGFDGLLIGETFMKTDDPAKTCREFILKIRELQKTGSQEIYKPAISGLR